MSDAIEVPVHQTEMTGDGREVDSAQLARNMAKHIAREMGAPNEEDAPPREPAPREPEDEQWVSQSEMEQPPEELVEQPPLEQPPAQEPQAAQPTDALYTQLLEMGIDLGVDRSALPPEAQVVYDRLGYETVSALESAQQRVEEAEVMKMQVQEFMNKIENNPSDVLNLIMLNDPSLFQKAIETYELVQSDEREASLLRREMEARLHEEAISRETTRSREMALQRQAQMFKLATAGACKRYGVDEALAQRYVANAITATRGQLTRTEIDAIVKDLRPAGARVRQPTTQQATRTAPREAVQTADQDRAPTRENTVRVDGPQAVKIQGSDHNAWRDRIRAAGERYDRTKRAD